MWCAVAVKVATKQNTKYGSHCDKCVESWRKTQAKKWEKPETTTSLLCKKKLKTFRRSICKRNLKWMYIFWSCCCLMMSFHFFFFFLSYWNGYVSLCFPFEKKADEEREKIGRKRSIYAKFLPICLYAVQFYIVFVWYDS